jgi:hypothetical protein
VVIAKDVDFIINIRVIGLDIRVIKGIGIIYRVVLIYLKTLIAETYILTLLIVLIIKALLSALCAIKETRIKVLRGSIYTLTQIGATSLTSFILKACATRTLIRSCALDPRT